MRSPPESVPGGREREGVEGSRWEHVGRRLLLLTENILEDTIEKMINAPSCPTRPCSIVNGTVPIICIAISAPWRSFLFLFFCFASVDLSVVEGGFASSRRMKNEPFYIPRSSYLGVKNYYWAVRFFFSSFFLLETIPFLCFSPRLSNFREAGSLTEFSANGMPIRARSTLRIHINQIRDLSTIALGNRGTFSPASGAL